MNRERRRQLRLWNEKMEALKGELETILWDEQDYNDNIPDNLQYSSRAENSNEAIEYMEEAIECIDEAIDNVYGII